MLPRHRPWLMRCLTPRVKNVRAVLLGHGDEVAQHAVQVHQVPKDLESARENAFHGEEKGNEVQTLLDGGDVLSEQGCNDNSFSLAMLRLPSTNLRRPKNAHGISAFGARPVA